MAGNPIRDVAAVQGNADTKPGWWLQVKGNIEVYAGGQVMVEVLENPFNPTIFMLRVSVANDQGPMKGIPKAFCFQKQVEAHKFKQVQINPGEENGLTVDIIEQKTVFLED